MATLPIRYVPYNTQEIVYWQLTGEAYASRCAFVTHAEDYGIRARPRSLAVDLALVGQL